MPLPHIDITLREIAYAYDTLKVDGVGMYTNYGDKWLGDPYFNPVFEELERRKAIVFTHPITADCCKNLINGIGDGAIEWQTDTTRAIAQMIFGGAAARHPNVRMIWSHGGGTMPYLIERFVRLPQTSKNAAANVPDGVIAMLGRFYYDVAQVSNAAAMAALTKVVPSTQIVFGTDFPFRTAADQMRGLQAAGLSADDLRRIEFENAQVLLPRWRAG